MSLLSLPIVERRAALIQLLAPDEVVGSIGKERVALVFSTQDGIGDGDAPVDVESLVQERDARIGLGSIVVVAFVLEHRFFGENRKTVGKTTRDEELEVIVLTEFYSYVLPKGGTALTDVYCHIQHAAARAAHEFALRVRHALIVQATHHTAGGTRFVVLHKVDGAH